MSEPRILVLDIETKPALSYHFQMFKVNIGLEQLVDPGGILCVGLKWFGSSKTYFYSEWEDGHKAMLEAVHEHLSEADAVVTYNGKKFDIPKLTGDFLLHGMRPPPPLTQIDLYQTVRNHMGLLSNKLAFVGPYFKIGRKVSHEGFALWRKVMEGDVRAQNKMKRYCIEDVRLTDRAYKLMRSFIPNHPHMGNAPSTACKVCGQVHAHSRGWRRTPSFRIQRLRCTNCGSWRDGKREKL